MMEEPSYVRRSSSGPYPDLVQDRRYSSADSKALMTLRHNTGIYFRACSFIGTNFLIFPFVSFRRQCQLNKNAIRFHLTPLSVLPVMFNYYGTWENAPMVFRGVSSYLLWKGTVAVTENVLSELLGMPKEVSSFNFNIGASRLTLKCLSFLAMSPLFVVYVIDSVQSGHRTVYDLINLIRDTCQRIVTGRTIIRGGFIRNKLSSVQSNLDPGVRLLNPLPYWTCVPLTTGLLVCSYVLRSTLFHLVCRPLCNKRLKCYQFTRRDYENVDSVDARSNCWQQFYVDMCAHLFADGLTMCIMYPLDTVVCRLIVQGCRVIIDDTDHGVGVLPVATYYESIGQCIESTLANEQIYGFFKGFGCLMSQFALQAAFAYFSRGLLRHVLDVIDSKSGMSSGQIHE